ADRPDDLIQRLVAGGARRGPTAGGGDHRVLIDDRLVGAGRSIEDVDRLDRDLSRAVLLLETLDLAGDLGELALGTVQRGGENRALGAQAGVQRGVVAAGVRR